MFDGKKYDLEYARRYYHEKLKNNPEYIAKDRARHAKWQKENKEHLSAYHKERRKALKAKQMEEEKK